MKCIVHRCRREAEAQMVLCTPHLGCDHYQPNWWRRLLDRLVDLLS